MTGTSSINAPARDAGPRFLARVLREDAPGAAAVMRSDGPGAAGLAAFAERHQLAGYFHAVLGKSPGLFPADFLAGLRAAYLKQWFDNEGLAREARSLAETFESEGGRFLLLKGLPLAQRFYGDIGQRRIADLDLLVRPREVPEAERLLGKAGFRRTSRLLFGGTLASRFTPCLEYKKENLGLDLHWQLRSHPSFRVDYDRLWRTSETAAVGDRAFGVPSAEYELLTQILSIFTDVQLGTILLKSFVDVHKILEAVEESLDWDRFFLDRREEGLLRISVNVLDLALDALDARDRFPRLGSRLAGHASCVRWTRREKKMRLLERSKAALRNKSWAFPLYETTPFRTFSWWALSLPFRVAASPTGRQKWKQRVER